MKSSIVSIFAFICMCSYAQAIERGSPAADIVDVRRNLERKEQNEKKDQKNWNDYDKMTKPQKENKK